MKFETQEKVVTGAMWTWAVGLVTFAVGGLLLDSWTVMGVGLAVLCIGLGVLGALL